jgi:hypothetical protein
VLDFDYVYTALTYLYPASLAMSVFESMTTPKCLSKLPSVASCSSRVKDALQSDRNKTLKSRMAPSRAVQSEQTLVATPVIAMVSRLRARIMGLRLDVGEDTDVRQVLALGRVQIDHRDPIRTAKAQQLLNSRHDIFRHRQVAHAARGHPNILHIDDDDRSVVHGYRPPLGPTTLRSGHLIPLRND